MQAQAGFRAGNPIAVTPDVAAGGQSLVGHRPHLDEPLVRQAELDRHLATVAAADRHHVIALVLEQVLRFQVLECQLAARVAIAAPVTLGHDLVHGRVLVHHVDRLEIVPLGDLEVVRIVRRRDLHAPGAHLGIRVLIDDDRDDATLQRKPQHAPDVPPVAIVLGIDRDRDVTEERFGPGRADDQVLFGIVLEGVPDVVHLPGLVLLVDLVVGKRRPIHGAPVDDALAAVDQPVFVQPDERGPHGSRETLVHREARALPVAAAADAAQLRQDLVAELLAPLPDAAHHLFAAERARVDTLGVELFLDDGLRRDAGVVGAGHPQGVKAVHALVAHQYVLQGVVQRVTHV
jgi:hypothetical protein